MWILLALLAGFFYALGNVAFGISYSQLGFYGAGFPAPISLALVIIYRSVEACKIKRRTGHLIDKANSNYWKVRQVDDEYHSSEAATYEFNWFNLRLVALTQGLPTLGGLVIVANAFKFALLRT